MSFTIEYQGITFGDDTYTLKQGISGIEKPPIRTSSGDWSGKDGGYVSAQLYSNRIITWGGNVIGNSCENHQDLRQALNSLPIRTLVPMTITTYDGRVFTIPVSIIDLKSDITWDVQSDYQITVLAPDPFFVLGGGAWNEVEVDKIVPGGYNTPYSLPVQWQVGTTPTTVTNSGDVTVYPQLVISGEVTNPIITNTTSGQYTQMNISTAPGDELIIDLNARTVTLNGGSVINKLVIGSTWWGLQPGNSVISFEATGSATFVKIRWQNKVSGI